MLDRTVGLDPDRADAYGALLLAAAERFEAWEAAAGGRAAALALTSHTAAPGAALVAAARACRAAAADLATRASQMRGVTWSAFGPAGATPMEPSGLPPFLTSVGAAPGVGAPAASGWGWGGTRPASGDDEIPDLDDIDLVEVADAALEGFLGTEASTYGVCAEVSAGADGTSGEFGGCGVSTPDDAGVIVYTGVGRSYGTPSVAVAAGTMASNADTLDQLSGPAVCMSGTAAMESAGVTGTLCASIDRDGQSTGVYVLSAGVAATSPGASGSVSVVDTEVAFSDGGALRVLRTPIDLAEDAGESILDGLEDDLESLANSFWR